MNNLDNLYVSVLEKLASVNNRGNYQTKVASAQEATLNNVYVAVLEKLASFNQPMTKRAEFTPEDWQAVAELGSQRPEAAAIRGQWLQDLPETIANSDIAQRVGRNFDLAQFITNAKSENTAATNDFLARAIGEARFGYDPANSVASDAAASILEAAGHPASGMAAMGGLGLMAGQGRGRQNAAAAAAAAEQLAGSQAANAGLSGRLAALLGKARNAGGWVDKGLSMARL